MKRVTSAVVAVLAAILDLVLRASALTFDQPDGTGHRNAGAMLVRLPGGNLAPVCSGTSTAPDVVPTASRRCV